MTILILEDGSQVTGANTYISEADLTTYATARGITIAGDTNILIIQSMDYIEAQLYIGFKFTDAQPLLWPRGNVVIDGYLLDADEIPQELIDGLAETALAIDAGLSPLANVPRTTKREKVGKIEVEYMDNASALTVVRTITTKLRKILAGNFTGITFTVSR